MCGCSSGSSFGLSGTSYCGVQTSRLSKSREKLAILYNTIKDPELKAKYKADRTEIEQILKQAASGEACPDIETIIFIETEVNNEYAKHYNT